MRILEDWPVYLILGGIIAILILGFIYLGNERERFMKECLADGRKRYECEALLKGGGTTLVPVFVPRVGR